MRIQRLGMHLAACAVILAACASLPPAAPLRESGYVPVNGIDQWVTLRGEDASKPILLVVHGGPADAQSSFPSAYATYERDFIVAQWDQRGAGRTFAKYGTSTPDVSLDQIVDDGVALAEHLRRRFPRNRIVLLGHSWGTMVATGMAQERPDLFAAYVGTGQIASWAAAVDFQFDYLKSEARKAGDTATVSSLETIGRPDPLNITQYFTFTRPLRQYMHASDRTWLSDLKTLAAANGETAEDIRVAGAGMDFSGAKLIQAIVREDLQATALRFSLPYCVIQGRHDVSTPTPPARAYFDKVSAPRKYYAVIEDAGHFAVVTHPDPFLAELKTCLRP